jgi:hypothetical protein
MQGYIGYIRVSTVKQGTKGVSLQEQRDAISRYAERNQFVISVWLEEMETAAKQGRPIFNQALKLLRTGKARGIILHKLDRGARNLRDWAAIGELSDQGVEIHFVNESLDLHSRGGRLSADIQAVVAADWPLPLLICLIKNRSNDFFKIGIDRLMPSNKTAIRVIDPTNFLANTTTGMFQPGTWHSAEGVTAIAACLTAFFAFLTLFSLILIRRQISADHERSRRERAVDLMTMWATSQDPTNAQIVFGIGLLNALTKEQCHAIWARETFAIESRNQWLLDAYRNSRASGGGGARRPAQPANDGPLALSLAEVYMLRSIASVTLEPVS